MPPPAPPDDVTIPHDEVLFLRVYPDPHIIYRDPETGAFRPGSGAFRSKEPLSVDLGSLTTARETRDRDTSARFLIVQFMAEQVRLQLCGITRDPEDDPPNPAHALLHGRRKDGGLTSGQRERLALGAIFVEIDNERPWEALHEQFEQEAAQEEPQPDP